MTARTRLGDLVARGTLRDALYLGMHTRYLVELDLGVDLVVVEQNRESDATETGPAKGRAVRLRPRGALRPIEADPN